MPTNFSRGLQKERTSNYTPLATKIGVHSAFMCGFSESWTQTDSCYDCNQRKPSPPSPDCTKCEGSGNVTQEYVGIKYQFTDGHIDQERVPMKITSPRSFTNREGRHITTRPSKLYERLIEFTKAYGNEDGEYAWSEQRLADWANTHQDDAECPVTVIIKQPGKYPKITEVLYRADTKPRPRTGRSEIQEMQGRAMENTRGPLADNLPDDDYAANDEHPFDDEEELPF